MNSKKQAHLPKKKDKQPNNKEPSNKQLSNSSYELFVVPQAKQPCVFVCEHERGLVLRKVCG